MCQTINLVLREVSVIVVAVVVDEYYSIDEFLMLITEKFWPDFDTHILIVGGAKKKKEQERNSVSKNELVMTIEWPLIND